MLANRPGSEKVKLARAAVLRDCLAAAENGGGPIFSLSVPTGGGKTLAAMAFALKRAMMNPGQFRRIIVVIPYLAIIEQNAQIYKDLFGEDVVLEHHSGTLWVKPGDRSHFVPGGGGEESYEGSRRLEETQNWDSPLIVTTSVRFFESLFSNHPSDLRRIHNIARSIVILDEVQVLPRRLLAPLQEMIRELGENWGCAFVLSTATKPGLERRTSGGRDSRWATGTVEEIIQTPEALYRELKRVGIEWRIEEPVGWDEVAEWMMAHKQCLTVVNTRGHASVLYDELAGMAEGAGVAPIHLSTRMCAAHRLEIIAAIRGKLRRGEPCHVVSTQLIEAGVDLDFPVAFRALAPLDSIVQAAGRADREGLLTVMDALWGGVASVRNFGLGAVGS